MSRITRWISVFVSAGIIIAITCSLGFAIFPVLQTRLSGAAIGGQIPEGDAKVNQSGLLLLPARLEVQVKNVNLPDNTLLDVILARRNVGTITLVLGEGGLFATFQFQVGRLDPIVLSDGVNVILAGGAPWKVSSESLETEELEE